MFQKKGKENGQLMKRWIALISICVLTILAAFLIKDWYHSYRVWIESGAVVDSSLKEVNDVELYNYLLESPSAYVYIGTSEDKDCRTFQKELEKYLEENSRLDQVIYLNIGTEEDSFYEEFNTNYKTTQTLNEIPAFVVFENGKAKNIYSGASLTIQTVQQALERSDFYD